MICHYYFPVLLVCSDCSYRFLTLLLSSDYSYRCLFYIEAFICLTKGAEEYRLFPKK